MSVPWPGRSQHPVPRESQLDALAALEVPGRDLTLPPPNEHGGQAGPAFAVGVAALAQLARAHGRLPRYTLEPALADWWARIQVPVLDDRRLWSLSPHPAPLTSAEVGALGDAIRPLYDPTHPQVAAHRLALSPAQALILAGLPEEEGRAKDARATARTWNEEYRREWWRLRFEDRMLLVSRAAEPAQLSSLLPQFLGAPPAAAASALRRYKAVLAATAEDQRAAGTAAPPLDPAVTPQAVNGELGLDWSSPVPTQPGSNRPSR